MGDTLRSALEKAFDKGELEQPEEVETPAEMPEPVETEAAPVEQEAVSEQARAERARDESGRFAKADKPISSKTPAPIVPKQSANATPAPKPQAPNVTPQPPAPVASATKPPQSWKPQAREKWGALPPEVQQEALRRETETARALQESAEARKQWDSFRQVVAPFEGMLRAEGAEPIAAVGELLRTAAALRTAPPAHKAQLVAQMIQTFGVPVETLAAALDGKAMPQQQAQPQFNPAEIEQRILQRLQGQQQQALLQKNASEVETFGQEREFFDEVREMMGDMMEVAAKRGLPLSLEQAYNQALRLHPDTSAVLAQREAGQQANAVQASTQRAKRASSSPRSHPAAPLDPGGKPKDLRAAIEAAMDHHSGR
jgi:hypothetical protein